MSIYNNRVRTDPCGVAEISTKVLHRQHHKKDIAISHSNLLQSALTTWRAYLHAGNEHIACREWTCHVYADGTLATISPSSSHTRERTLGFYNNKPPLLYMGKLWQCPAWFASPMVSLECSVVSLELISSSMWILKKMSLHSQVNPGTARKGPRK